MDGLWTRRGSTIVRAVDGVLDAPRTSTITKRDVLSMLTPKFADATDNDKEMFTNLGSLLLRLLAPAFGIRRGSTTRISFRQILHGKRLLQAARALLATHLYHHQQYRQQMYPRRILMMNCFVQVPMVEADHPTDTRRLEHRLTQVRIGSSGILAKPFAACDRSLAFFA